ASPWSSCRCRFDSSTSSGSTMERAATLPGGAAASASATGEPRPPAPTIRTRRPSGKELIEGEVALAGVAEHGDDRRALAELPRHLQRHVHRRAGGDADEEPLLAGEAHLGQ